MVNVTIVGSRALELDGDVAQIILDELIELGDRGFDEILVRKPLRRAKRPFEALVSSLAEVMGFRVTDFTPDVGGRAQVFFRDIDMVKQSDEVVAFFPPEHEMAGGTAHVVDKALDQKKPVRAYAVVSGRRILIGSDNEEGVYSRP